MPQETQVKFAGQILPFIPINSRTRDSNLLRPACLALVIMSIFRLGNALALEDGWGNLSGRFVYAGIPPKQKFIQVTRDEDVFGPTISDQSLIVNTENRGIANVVVYVRPKKGTKLRVHPSYKETEKSKVRMTMSGGLFKPRVLLLRTTQTLEQVNDDKEVTAYSPHFGCRKNVSALIPLMQPRRHVIRRDFREERYPCPVHCAIYPWIRSSILIRSNPYMAKTDEDGRYSIKNLPVGEHTFDLWHEIPGLLKGVQMGEHVSNYKGRVTIAIKQGDNILSDAPVSPSLLETD